MTSLDSSLSATAEDARPLAAEPKTASTKKATYVRTEHSLNDTLQDRCRSVIAANLERYPPQAIGVLASDVEAWESIVRERNERTKPNAGTGGLDGTGRLLPAVSDRFLAEVERHNPLFTESAIVDRMAWRDCVEYRFRSGGLTRPAALQYPWPTLVNELKRSGDALIELLNTDMPSDRKQELLEQSIHVLKESPMNVKLLQESGVGKAVKKFIKSCAKDRPNSVDVHTERPVRGSQAAKIKSALSPLAQLEDTLHKWKDIASRSGVQRIGTSDRKDDDEESSFDDQEDLLRAERCHSWRELFAVLQEREEKRRLYQGARMRKIRKKLDKSRPTVIKVRPAKSRHDSMLERAEKRKAATEKGYSSASFSAATVSTNSNKKMAALKKESKIATSLQKSAARPKPKNSSFGSAVAFATNSQSTSRKRTGQIVSLAGGKRMKLPEKAVAKKPAYRTS